MVQFFCFLLSFFYVQRPGGRGLGGRVQSGDDLSVACGDSIPTPFVPSGHFPLIGGIGPWEGSLWPLRRGDLSGAARQLPFARGAKGLTGISFCSSCRRKKEGTLFWQFMGRMM